VGVIAEHDGRIGGRMADQIIADNDQRDSRRTQVLLRAGVEQGEFGNVQRLRESAA